MSSLDDMTQSCPACDECDDALGHTCGLTVRQMETCRPAQPAAPDSWPAGDCLRCETEATQASCQEPHTCTSDAAPDSRPAPFTRYPIAGEPRPGDPWPEIALRHAETVNLEAVYGCNICGAEFPGNGFIHYCRRTPDAPRAGGPGASYPTIPLEVDAELRKIDCPAAGDRWHPGLSCAHCCSIRAVRDFMLSEVRKVHHLSAENARLAGEVVRLNSVGAAKTSTIAALCDTTDEIERQARIKALEWALEELCAGEVGLGGRIEAEIQRLQAAPGGLAL